MSSSKLLASLFCGFVAATSLALDDPLYTQDFEDVVKKNYTSFTLMTDGWATKYGYIQTASGEPQDIGTKFSRFPINKNVRFWASPATTNRVGAITFQYRLTKTGTSAEAPVEIIVGTSETQDISATEPAPVRQVVATLSLEATDWTTVEVDLTGVETQGRYITISRETVDTTTTTPYQFDLDNIVLTGMPALLLPTGLGVGSDSLVCSMDISPVMPYETSGIVDNPTATLHWRLADQSTWAAVAMVHNEDDHRFGLAIPLNPFPNGTTQSGCAIEFYVSGTFVNSSGDQTYTYPAGGAAAPVRVELTPFSNYSNMRVRGGFTSTLALATNGVWRGGMRASQGRPNTTYSFEEDVTTWGTAGVLYPSFKATGSSIEVGGNCSTPATIDRDILFGFDEPVGSLQNIMYVEKGEFQSFEDANEFRIGTWALANSAECVSSNALFGSGSLRMPAGATVTSPLRDNHEGVFEIGVWIMRSEVEARTAGVKFEVLDENGQPMEIRPNSGLLEGSFTVGRTQQYVWRSYTVSSASAKRVRLTALQDVFIDGLAIADFSNLILDADNAIVDTLPVFPGERFDITVPVENINGAIVNASSGATLYYNYGDPTGPFTATPLQLNDAGTGYTTAKSTGITPTSSAADLNYYVEVTFTGWDGSLAAATTVRSDIHTVPITPVFSTATMELAGAYSKSLLLASDNQWRGTFRPNSTTGSFWLKDAEDNTYGYYNDTCDLPLSGTAYPNRQFTFNTAYDKSITVSINDETHAFVMRRATVEDFESATSPEGWTTDGISFSNVADGALGRAATVTKANAYLMSALQDEPGIGEVSFWARTTELGTSVNFRVQISSDNFANSITVAEGSVNSVYWRNFYFYVGSLTGTKARITFEKTGVEVDEFVVSTLGPYVELANPTIAVDGTQLDINTSPLIAYNSKPTMTVQATGRNGANGIKVNVVYCYDFDDTVTIPVRISGNPTGGEFTGTMPGLGVGVIHYWFEASFTGNDSATIRYPETGHYTYEVSGDIGWQRRPTYDDAWKVTGTKTYDNAVNLPANAPGGSAAWRVQQITLSQYEKGVVQFLNPAEGATAETSPFIRSPQLDGLGSIYFSARVTDAMYDTHTIAIERAITATGPWTLIEEVQLPYTLDWTNFRLVINDYETGNCFVRFRRTSRAESDQTIVMIGDILITPPPADVVLSEPAVLSPGYPSQKNDITFTLDVRSVDSRGRYPAANFRPTLVYKLGESGEWESVPMEQTGTTGSGATATSHFNVTLPAFGRNGTLFYYSKVEFDGPYYMHKTYTTNVVDGVTNVVEEVFNENRSPSYLGNNNVQTWTIDGDPEPKTSEVRLFDSHHRALELVCSGTMNTNYVMSVSNDETWQLILYLTNAISIQTYFQGLAPYDGGPGYIDVTEYWGDNNQETINPPIGGMVQPGSQDPITVEMDYTGFVMFRLDLNTRSYEVRRAAYQDFNSWQASDTYFEDSIGLFAIQEFTSKFDGVEPTNPATTLAIFNSAPVDEFVPPAIDAHLADLWRLENAWVIEERDLESSGAGQIQIFNHAVRINPAAGGNVQSTSYINTPGREFISFRHRVSIGGDRNFAYYRRGFGWADYSVSARCVVSSISPDYAYISLIGYYVDDNNYYEMRIRQGVSDVSGQRPRVEMYLYRVKDGVETCLINGIPGTPATSDKWVRWQDGRSIVGTWQLSMWFTTTASGTVSVDCEALHQSGTRLTTRQMNKNTSQYECTIPYVDAAAGSLLASGGSVAVNLFDARATFDTFSFTAWPAGGEVPAYNNVEQNWYLGRVSANDPAHAAPWRYTNGGITHVIPTITFKVGVAKVGLESELPSSADFTTLELAGASSSLSYTTFRRDIRTWENAFFRIKPDTTYDGSMLVIDNLETRDWRGLELTDPLVPLADPQSNTVWRASQAYITRNGNRKEWELTRSRANPDQLQCIRSPILEDGMGTISFNYRVTGGAMTFIVERNAYNGAVDDEDSWEPVSENATVTSASSSTQRFYYAMRIDSVVGRVRIRVLDGSSDAGSLYIWDLRVTTFPPRDKTSWEAYNVLITGNRGALGFEPDDPHASTAYLNNSQTADVQGGDPLNSDKPYIQSPEINTGIGEIGFWYRAWDSTRAGKLKIFVSTATTNDLSKWSEIVFEDPDTAATYAGLQNITNLNYQYFRVETCDFSNKVVRIYSDTNDCGRVAIDNILITEPVRSSIDIVDVVMSPDIPLADDPVALSVQLGNPRMNPTNIQVFVDYCLNTNLWGVANWASNPANYRRLQLQQDPDDPFHYYTREGECIPAQPVDSVVQYRVVCTYGGRQPSPVYFTNHTTPEWYKPVNLNDLYADKGFSPYYFVFSCPTGVVFINEFHNAVYEDTVNQEFVEIIGPRNLSLAKWSLELIDAAASSDAEKNVIRSVYEIPGGSYLHDGTNGWGFFLLGDSDVGNLGAEADYVFPDGGNPQFADPMESYFPESGGLCLKRSMGAYVDRVSYGPDNWAMYNLVEQGYVYAGAKGYWDSISSFYLSPNGDDPATSQLKWYTQEDSTLLAMNTSAEARFLGEIEPYPEPQAQEEVAGLQCTIYAIDINEAEARFLVRGISTNGIADLKGWYGYLQTNGVSPTAESGWGDVVGAEFNFGSAEFYEVKTSARQITDADSMFFRVRAYNAN